MKHRNAPSAVASPPYGVGVKLTALALIFTLGAGDPIKLTRVRAENAVAAQALTRLSTASHPSQI